MKNRASIQVFSPSYFVRALDLPYHVHTYSEHTMSGKGFEIFGRGRRPKWQKLWRSQPFIFKNRKRKDYRDLTYFKLLHFLQGKLVFVLCYSTLLFLRFLPVFPARLLKTSGRWQTWAWFFFGAIPHSYLKKFSWVQAKPLLKIRTANAIFWIYLGSTALKTFF